MFTRYYSNIILCLCYVSKMNTFKVKQCDTFVLYSRFFFFIRTEQTLQNFKSRNILHPSAIPPSMNAHVFIAKVWKQSILFYHRNNIPHFYALVIFFWGLSYWTPVFRIWVFCYILPEFPWFWIPLFRWGNRTDWLGRPIVE